MPGPLAVLDHAPTNAPLLEELHEPLERQLLGPMRAIGLNTCAPVITARPLPVETRRVTSGNWAVAASYHADPVVAHCGGVIPAPKQQRRQLADLHRAGASPDLLFILRELPADWEPGTPPPKMVAVEAARSAHEHQLEIATGALTFGVQLLHVAAGLIAGTAAVAAAAAAGGAVAAGAVSLVALDPIVLGGLVHPSGAVAWVPLAAWDEIDVRARA